ncbi:hypothetical protein [Spirilliplanes yamanashiensis]|uniref:Uncharacterized protein n=1 Tax=Spirilliplanes yamanashiensis TaxID=42233 RepID=A0A8J3YE43_9ACTN|nr:hypothetical protein [Spirilliplanes yamanashiensis]MDP9816528.1 hypothetical protein [Spirilliplanes yamanashiensis]GIJ06055.1 hypothetical protein Sya03_54070 [Spirilliplanes yamanashiensis]
MTPTGLTLGHREPADADHWIRALAPAPEVACTHLLRTPQPHVAISLSPATDALPPGATASPAAAAAHGLSGRAVVFPGWAGLVGTVTAHTVLTTSAIEEIAVLGGGTLDPDDEIDTRDHVRPVYLDGVLTLQVTPVAGGRWAPFEVPDPTPCCAGH